VRENKKRIFLILCYLLLIVAMAGTVSWARYKKELDGTVLLTKAADFQASLRLKDDSRENLIAVLTELKPGQTASDNQSAGKHGLEFIVTNADIPGSGQASDKPIQYTIRVYGKGHIPMSMVLYDKKTGISYEGTEVARDDGCVFLFEADGQREYEFSLPGETEASNSFILYVGWKQSEAENGGRDYDDQKYMKEVERLEIRATIRNDATGMEIPSSSPVVKEAPLLKKTDPVE